MLLGAVGAALFADELELFCAPLRAVRLQFMVLALAPLAALALFTPLGFSLALSTAPALLAADAAQLAWPAPAVSAALASVCADVDGAIAELLLVGVMGAPLPGAMAGLLLGTVEELLPWAKAPAPNIAKAPASRIILFRIIFLPIDVARERQERGAVAAMREKVSIRHQLFAKKDSRMTAQQTAAAFAAVISRGT